MARNAIAFEVKDMPHGAAPAGAYQFVGDGLGGIDGINHACPCGCGKESYLRFASSKSAGDKWTVQGEWPKVTLSPSIGIHPLENGRYHWHGYLENGVFVER